MTRWPGVVCVLLLLLALSEDIPAPCLENSADLVLPPPVHSLTLPVPVAFAPQHHSLSLWMVQLRPQCPCLQCCPMNGGASGKEPTCQCRGLKETQIRFLGWEDALENGMATHSRVPVWRILWTEEPGGLQSIELQGVGHS